MHPSVPYQLGFGEAPKPAREGACAPQMRASPRVMIAANTGLFRWVITLGFQVGQKFVETSVSICVAVRLKSASIVTITANRRSSAGCIADGLATSVRNIHANQTRCAFGCRHLADPTVARIEVLLIPPIHFQFRSALLPPDELIILVPLQ
jgi:hypothetical protein